MERHSIRFVTFVFVSIVSAILLASALNQFTRVTGPALAEAINPAGLNENSPVPNLPRAGATRNYLPIIFLNSATAGGAWLLSGNTGTTTNDFLGTTDNMTLTLRVSNTIAFRLIPAGGGTPNLVGGYSGNVISPTVVGGTISGGGASGGENKVWANYATIAGGQSNTASGAFAIVGGGYLNTASGLTTTIGGGKMNTAFGDYTTIAGGFANTASGGDSTIGGGYNNRTIGPDSVIAGGSNNIASSNNTTIGGGELNNATNWYATVGGGIDNTASGISAFVGGGGHNGTIWDGNQALATASAIVGGFGNTASGIGAFIGGGGYNGASSSGNNASASASTIGGGMGNVISSTGSYAFIGGGWFNTAGNPYATIGGGAGNTASNQYVTIGGGMMNTASAQYATIGGGSNNKANNQYTTIAGGWSNTVSNQYATIGGGVSNNASGDHAVIGGGSTNTASNMYAVVVGGLGNNAGNLYAFIGGGSNQTASGIGSFIGGGTNNTVSGYYASIPGGSNNTATMSYTFAAGRHANAIHQGAFVWADSTGTDFTSTGNDQFLIRADGGVGINGASFVTTTTALQVDKGNIMVRGSDNFAGVNNQAILYLGDTNQYIKSIYGSGIRIGSYGAVDALALQELTGNVGVGTTSPNDKLEVNGIIRVASLGAAGATTLCRNASNQIATCSSSLRYKNNVNALTLGLDAINQLRPVTFNWNETRQADLGFVAEQVHNVTPLLTTLNSDGQIEGVKYDRLTAILVKGMQEQQAQLHAKDAEIAKLQAQNAAQQKVNAQLDARLAALEQTNGIFPANVFNSNTLPLWSIAGLLALWLMRHRK